MVEARTLILLRHGQTAWNLERRIQGQTDAELDETGHAQARAAAKEIATLRPGLIWSSDLSRASVTAAYVGEACGLPVTLDFRLREFHLGERQGFSHGEYAALDADEFADFRGGNYDRVPGAEPTAVVRSRMVSVLTDLLVALAPGQLGVAISHGAAIRVAVAALLGWPDRQFHTLRGLDNCAWAVVGEHPGVGRLRLAAYNRVAPGIDC
ncbi:MAG: histidine phosphatase family protein [Nocardioides sp.]